jgi:hypothetical protein
VSERLGVYALKNRQTGQTEDAELFSPVDARHIADFDQHWKPAIHQRLRTLPRGTPASVASLEDWGWDWQRKADVFSGRLDYQSFALECSGRTQGLMLCSLVHIAREDSQRNQHLVYVEFLHTAPWNRPLFTPTPLYKGVGAILLATAVSLSIEQEFNGRIGLHSLPQSEEWYRDFCGMADLGIDEEYQRLRYFEMTADQAARFLAM